MTIDPDADPREQNLPRWAQITINALRERLRAQHHPLVVELNRLRPRMDLLRRRNEALTELLSYAAAGGHPKSAEIMNILDEFDLRSEPVEKDAG